MELQVFESTEFGKVRTVQINGEPYFVGKDIAEALGYSNYRDAISRHCKGVVKHDTPTESGIQEMSFIPESDVYRLIFRSKLPSAEKFETWVVGEVLPAIRKHGAYMTEETLEKALTSPDFLIKLATELKKEKTKNKELTEKTVMQEQLIGELKPKADYVDTILCNKGLTPITHIAKDYGYSGKGFNKLLHDLGVQYKVGKQWVLYSKYQAMGYTHSKQYEGITNGIGEIVSNMEWTQKGRLFLYNFLKAHNIVPMIEQDD